MVSVLRESTDTGAPVLKSIAGSLTNLLKTVLVDGYGTKEGMGWSVVFQDAISHKLVIRGADDGTRTNIRISDNNTEKYFQYALCSCYESMSDIDIGYMQCPILSADTTFSNIIKNSQNSPTSEIPWKIIGDNKGFWFLVRSFFSQYGDDEQYGLLWEPHYLGDYVSYDITNKYNFISILHRNDITGSFSPDKDDSNSIMRNPFSENPGAKKVVINPEFFHLKYGNHSPESCIDLYLNGKRIYDTPQIILDDMPIGVVPGMQSMIWRSPIAYEINVGYYQLTYNEQLPIIEQTEKTSLLTLPARSESASASAYGGGANRITYVIGEGFRYAY